MEKIKVFLDSDVVISALLSSKGASYEVVTNTQIKKFISKGTINEVEAVSSRLSISRASIKSLFKRMQILTSVGKKDEILKKYSVFVNDLEDAHIVAAADAAKVRFLLTFNIRHYKIGRIKDKLGILVIKPGLFLQYLRSLK